MKIRSRQLKLLNKSKTRVFQLMKPGPENTFSCFIQDELKKKGGILSIPSRQQILLNKSKTGVFQLMKSGPETTFSCFRSEELKKEGSP